MNRNNTYLPQHFLVIVLVTLLTGCTVEADTASMELKNTPEASVSDERSSTNSERLVDLDEVVKKIDKFIEHNKSLLAEPSSDSFLSVRKRLVAGFQQAPPKQIQTLEGLTIVWGWQEGQAENQSLAIFDRRRDVRMVGIATAIPIIYSSQSDLAINSLEEYQALLQNRLQYMPPPELHLYAANQKDADEFYPLTVRWLQAAMMGFNTHCDALAQTASCRVAAKVQVPVFLHTSACNFAASSASECDLITPVDFTKASTALDDFKQ